jgi:hypothetical protein
MVQMVHPEGVSHKGTKPDYADRRTELNGPIVLGYLRSCPMPLVRLMHMTDFAFSGE